MPSLFQKRFFLNNNKITFSQQLHAQPSPDQHRPPAALQRERRQGHTATHAVVCVCCCCCCCCCCRRQIFLPVVSAPLRFGLAHAYHALACSHTLTPPTSRCSLHRYQLNGIPPTFLHTITLDSLGRPDPFGFSASSPPFSRQRPSLSCTAFAQSDRWFRSHSARLHSYVLTAQIRRHLDSLKAAITYH